MAYDPEKQVSVRVVQEDGTLGDSQDMREEEAFPLINSFTAFFTNPVDSDRKDFKEWGEAGPEKS